MILIKLPQRYKIVNPENENLPPRPRPTLANPRSAADLENDYLPEPTWNISGLLPTGLALLAGAPKVGKSWLVLAFALAMATGAPPSAN